MVALYIVLDSSSTFSQTYAHVSIEILSAPDVEAVLADELGHFELAGPHGRHTFLIQSAMTKVKYAPSCNVKNDDMPAEGILAIEIQWSLRGCCNAIDPSTSC